MDTHTFSSPRHTTKYWTAGPADGPLMLFLHGWPEIALVWRAQVEAFATEGWHCVAPDMRGYGGSSAPKATAAYTVEKIVDDMLELHDHLGGSPAVWAGHDWGSPIAAAITSHHPARSKALILISVPYFPTGFALPSFLPLIDRTLYPGNEFLDGQWDYFRFYQTHFEQTVRDFNADIPATLASIYRPGNPDSVGEISPTALVTRNGGRYGAAHRAPNTTPDPSLWPAADFDTLVSDFTLTGFRPCNAWYLNDEANIAFAATAPNGGKIFQPVLFINGAYDAISNIKQSRVGEPMKLACTDLTVSQQPAGHWLPLERKSEVTDDIRNWLKVKKLKFVVI